MWIKPNKFIKLYTEITSIFIQLLN